MDWVVHCTSVPFCTHRKTSTFSNTWGQLSNSITILLHTWLKWLKKFQVRTHRGRSSALFFFLKSFSGPPFFLSKRANPSPSVGPTVPLAHLPTFNGATSDKSNDLRGSSSSSGTHPHCHWHSRPNPIFPPLTSRIPSHSSRDPPPHRPFSATPR